MAGGIYEQSEWPDSRWDCVTVCDGCHTVVWGTFWDDYDSAARDAYFGYVKSEVGIGVGV